MPTDLLLGEENEKCDPCCWLKINIPIIDSPEDLEKENENCKHQWELKGTEVCRQRPSLWFWECHKYQCLQCDKKMLVQQDLGDMGFVCGVDNSY